MLEESQIVLLQAKPGTHHRTSNPLHFQSMRVDPRGGEQSQDVTVFGGGDCLCR